MSRKRSTHRRRSCKARKVTLHKPNGTLHPRVKQVGPEHFGIVSVDCAKARSVWLMSDFYGNLLVEPTAVEHNRGGLELAILQVREIAEQHQLKDLVVAVERTGNYHLPIKRAFQRAIFRDGPFDVRIVHPFATKQHRQPANPDDKTDENDLAAIFRATVAGYGLIEPALDEVHWQLRLLARHRRDLVEKRTALCCQIREQLQAILPGYAALFDDKLWESNVALPLARRVTSPWQIIQLGVTGLDELLRKEKIRFQQRTLEKIVAWAHTAATPDEYAATQHRIFVTLDDDRRQKTLETTLLERDLVHWLVRTPYVLLMSCPGINVISSAELGGELGPIANYAKSSRITGRAGLYRSRYQSDEVDKQDGPLVRMCNRQLRAVLMRIADNLILCNSHYRGLANLWRSKEQDERYIRTKIATRFSRLAFQLVAGQQVLHHPGMRGRGYILHKLMTFHQEHQTPLPVMLDDLQNAAGQLPETSHAEEAKPLVDAYVEARARRRGTKPIADILPAVVARLGVSDLQLDEETRETS